MSKHEANGGAPEALDRKREPPIIADECDLFERFRVELRYFAHHVRGLDPGEAERAIENLTEDFVRMAREHAFQLTRALRREEPSPGR